MRFTAATVSILPIKLRSTPVGWPPKAGASCAPRPASITSCTPDPAARPHNRHLIPGASSRIAGRRSQQDGRPLFEAFTFHSLPPADEALRPALRALADEEATYPRDRKGPRLN